jgi:hypothetical protein
MTVSVSHPQETKKKKATSPIWSGRLFIGFELNQKMCLTSDPTNFSTKTKIFK